MKISMMVSQLGPTVLDILLDKMFPGSDLAPMRGQAREEINEQINKAVDLLQELEITNEHKAKAAWIGQHAVMTLMHHTDVSNPEEAVALVGNVLRAALIEAKKT